MKQSSFSKYNISDSNYLGKSEPIELNNLSSVKPKDISCNIGKAVNIKIKDH